MGSINDFNVFKPKEIIMKVVQTKECLTCENLIKDKMMDDYICKLETQAMDEFIGKTKLEIEFNEKTRRCLKD